MKPTVSNFLISCLLAIYIFQFYNGYTLFMLYFSSAVDCPHWQVSSSKAHTWGPLIGSGAQGEGGVREWGVRSLYFSRSHQITISHHGRMQVPVLAVLFLILAGMNASTLWKVVGRRRHQTPHSKIEKHKSFWLLIIIAVCIIKPSLWFPRIIECARGARGVIN